MIISCNDANIPFESNSTRKWSFISAKTESKTQNKSEILLCECMNVWINQWERNSGTKDPLIWMSSQKKILNDFQAIQFYAKNEKE